ncbi:MAG: alpha/beta hydrolase, partial [Pseudomonadota bacterium]
AELEKGKISYRVKGNGAPLFFLHGLNGSSKSWIQQFCAFGDQYRVIAWDAPGYIESDVVSPDVDTYADVARDLLDHLDVGDAMIIGHSMGGVVAGRFAHRHKDKTSRLVLSCSHYGNAEPPNTPLAEKYSRRIDELQSMTRADYGQLRASKILPPSTQAHVKDAIAEMASDARQDGLRAAGTMVQNADNRSALSTLQMPCLIISADCDTVVPPSRTQTLLDAIPNAAHVELRGLGHAPYLEDPSAFNTAIQQFA